MLSTSPLLLPYCLSHYPLPLIFCPSSCLWFSLLLFILFLRRLPFIGPSFYSLDVQCYSHILYRICEKQILLNIFLQAGFHFSPFFSLLFIIRSVLPVYFCFLYSLFLHDGTPGTYPPQSAVSCGSCGAVHHCPLPSSGHRRSPGFSPSLPLSSFYCPRVLWVCLFRGGFLVRLPTCAEVQRVLCLL